MILLQFGGNLLLFLLPVLPAGILAASLSRRSHDEWQLLAWVPVLPLAIWAVILAIAVTRDPTSHNLWPFELIGWYLLSGALFGLFGLGRWVASRSESSRTSRRPFR